MPVRILVTAGTAAEYSQASTLIEGLDAQYLLADKGCDSDALVSKVETSGMKVVIPPRCNRKQPVNTTGISIGTDIWWIMPFFTSNAGETLQPDTPRIPLHSWLHYNPMHRSLGGYLMTTLSRDVTFDALKLKNVGHLIKLTRPINLR